jgi:hypothetical protein
MPVQRPDPVIPADAGPAWRLVFLSPLPWCGSA